MINSKTIRLRIVACFGIQPKQLNKSAAASSLIIMGRLSAEAVWNMTGSQLKQLLDSEKLISKSKKIRFYAPSFTYYKTAFFCNSSKDFPTLSVTGNSCVLNCKHCGGIILETMYPAKTPKELLTLCENLKREGARGVLISGGCLQDGSVPLQKFANALGEIKTRYGLMVFVHTGIVDSEKAQQLKQAEVDAALIDIIGSDETLHEVCNLNTTASNYENSLRFLQEVGVAFVPHVIVGLDKGKLKGEYLALNMIKPFNPSAIVILSFMPIRGTLMEKTKPPTPQEIAKTVATTRIMFPQTPLVLGCMRPKGKHSADTDVLAMKAGVDGIAFPSEEAFHYAKVCGYEVELSSFCCAQIYKDLAAHQTGKL